MKIPQLWLISHRSCVINSIQSVEAFYPTRLYGVQPIEILYLECFPEIFRLSCTVVRTFGVRARIVETKALHRTYRNILGNHHINLVMERWYQPPSRAVPIWLEHILHKTEVIHLFVLIFNHIFYRTRHFGRLFSLYLGGAVYRNYDSIGRRTGWSL